MNKAIVYIYISISLLFAASACKKLETPQVSTDRNPTSYRLKSMSFSGGSEFRFFYNGSNLVDSIEYGDRVTLNGQSYISFSAYIFEYSNGLCTRMRNECGCSQDMYSYTYEYNTDQQLIKKTCWSRDTAVAGYGWYWYDAAGRLIGAHDSISGVRDYEYSYDSSGNLTQYVIHYGPVPAGLYQQHWSHFDDKINFARTINGLPIDVLLSPIHSFQSPNNYVDHNGEPISYEYNEEGLPVKQNWSRTYWTFEYEKFR